MIADLTAAIRFITVLPLGSQRAFSPAGMIPYFPVVGLLLGGITALLDPLFHLLWSRPTASLLDVLLLVTLTGAFHLDGLGDTADGLYGQRDRESALRIMKDSRIGVMALVAVVGCLAVKWAGICGLESRRALLLVIIPAYARGSMLFGIRLLPYARPEGGTGHSFFAKPLPWLAFWGLLPPFALSLFGGRQALLLNGGFLLITAGMLFFYRKKINGITGDMLGALAEVMEAGLFLVAAAGGAP
jgi:adenosylcobinamide-GDP ribazoletransferase